MEKLKYIVAAVLLFMVSFVGGCVGADAKTAEAYEQARMSWIEGSGNFDIYKDNRTGVHYLVYKESDRSFAGSGTGLGVGVAMCVLVDAEGKPLVDKGE